LTSVGFGKNKIIKIQLHPNLSLVKILRRQLKTIALMITSLMLSITGQVWAVTQDSEYEVETVGGKLSPINFVTTFLVPILIIIGIFAAMLIVGLIRIDIEKMDENKDAQA
jgi:hypothetical protein